ncbi:hypothetical protein [Desulfobotulus sp.]|jgi:hypothetical protein|uniref:hypothetical protein n=1 Tax=Desulfobotulus sp. TaxID=1940337 RepID=UPI002A368A87|nr:hypothetical protein [Desulfobotulus sp.]MDY0162958.1 hypothetical protein [Desulfobotulus sp.]
MKMTHTLEIAHTWQGFPLADEERTEVRMALTDTELRLWLEAPYHGDPAPAQPAGSTERLWEYEVVEIFLVGADGRYIEIEMGPQGHYLVLFFKDVRCLEKAHIPLAFQAKISGPAWQGSARLAREHLPLPLTRVNAFAIHGQGEKRRYLCAHPTGGGVPDFHQPALFPPLPC